ncbi:uncharacterized protein LOC143904125 isoform X1 [Temnothorax americanus]|uniref:uncharacterized protein LOC143904125 isoform X1 n=1 Tax=Temnothorax americanus TaxID=1964332 RepID=UPI004068A3D4
MNEKRFTIFRTDCCLTLRNFCIILSIRKYKKGISFSDDASVSAGLGGIGGKLKKNIGVTVPHSLLNIIGLSDESDSKEIGLNIEGGIGLKPKLSLGGSDAGFGISLGGNGGLDIGMSGNHNKRPSEKEHSDDKHDKSKKHQKSAEEFNSSGIWGSITHILGGNAESDHADHKTSLDTDKISADLGDGISTDVTGKKYREHEEHKEHHTKHNGSKGHQSSTSMNWTANKHLEENKNSYWDKGDIIVIPLSDKEKSDEDVDRNGNDNSHVKKSSKENEIKNSGKKRENGNDMERGENITILHGKDGQHSGSDKGRNNGNGNSNSHVKGGSIVISHRDNETKEQKASEQTKTKNSGEKEGNSSNYDKGKQSGDHTGGRNNDVKRENTNHNNGEDGIINGSHSNENRNKNSTEHDGVVAGKKSDIKMTNGPSCNYDEILSTGKCGSNIKSTLQLVQTFIRSFDVIVHFLLEQNGTDLRKVLCQVLPHNSKLSCQLGCDVLRVKPILKYF